MLVAVVEDISARKARETEINERALRQQQLAELSASLPGAMCIYRQQPDGSSRPEFATAAFGNVIGYTPQTGGDWEAGNFKNVHPDDIAGLLQSLAGAARERKPWRAEYRVNHPEKGLIYIEESSAPEIDADGATVWYCFLQDVTAQKRAEQQLTEQQQLFSSILATALDGVMAVDNNQNIAVFNSAAERMFKLRATDVVGRHFSMLTRQDCSLGPPPIALDSAVLSPPALSPADGMPNGTPPQIRRMIGLRGDGTEFPVEMSTSRTDVGGQDIYTAILRDISVRDRDEADLRQAAAVFENSQEAICITDPAGIVTAVNPSFRKMAGLGHQDAGWRGISLLKVVRILFRTIPPYHALGHRFWDMAR